MKKKLIKFIDVHKSILQFHSISLLNIRFFYCFPVLLYNRCRFLPSIFLIKCNKKLPLLHCSRSNNVLGCQFYVTYQSCPNACPVYWSHTFHTKNKQFKRELGYQDISVKNTQLEFAVRASIDINLNFFDIVLSKTTLAHVRNMWCNTMWICDAI